MMLQIMFSFMHKPIVLFHKTSIYRQEPWVLILCSLILYIFKRSLAFYESPKSTISCKSTVLLKENCLDGLRGSILTTHLHL